MLRASIAPRLVFVSLLAPLTLLACSSDDSSPAPGATSPLFDATSGGRVVSEAGAACATNDDCAPGLACLYPATTCDAFKVCAPPIPSTCAQAQTVCSCLGTTIAACGGYATEPVDHAGACGDSGAALDASLPDSTPPQDQAAPPVDAPPDVAADAADAASE